MREIRKLLRRKADASFVSPPNAMAHQEVKMTDTAPPTGIAHLEDAELLSLYLSLPRPSREKAFISTVQAAEITGVSMRTIQLWIESGVVRAIPIGGKYRIVFESLRAYLHGRMNKQSH
jgi:excisionase family DNA binding protein